MKRILISLIWVSVLCLPMACGDNTAVDARKEIPPDHPKVSQQSPAWSFSGTIKETRDVSEYTYCLVSDGKAKKWIAIPRTEVKIGEPVTFSNGLVMKDFYSKTLDRHFDEVIFCTGINGQPIVSNTESGHGEMPAMPPEHGMPSTGAQCPVDKNPPMGMTSHSMASPSPIAFKDIHVTKAEGKNGFRISELYQKASDLSGSKIRVQGKVVKVLPNIMKKNWIHIQDGTGDPEKNTHDLTITSLQSPAVGDTVTVSGTLKRNADFGSGFTYDIFIENAAIETR